MTPLLISGLAFLAIFGGALGGVWLAHRLPEPHLSSESRTAVSVSMAVVGTMAALVLSLLISNASTSFNTQAAAVDNLAIDIVKLDRTLVRLGGETAQVQGSLKTYAMAKLRELSGRGDRSHLDVDTLKLLETVSDGILALRPADARSRQIQQRALTLVDAITDARWTLAETAGSAIPQTFLVVLVFWLALLFASFGLFAPRNSTVLAALLMCTLAISGGIFIILELGSPTSGLIRVPVAELAMAVRQIGLSGQ